jgi:hypothetical protein
MLGPSNAHDSNGSHEPDRAPAEPVEQRLRRLEDAVAALQDTAVIEDRVAARVVRQIDRKAMERSPVDGLRDTAGLIVDAGRMLLPKSVEALPPHEPPPAADGAADPPPSPKPSWLAWEVVREARTLYAMFRDPRYRFSWAARVVPLAAFVIAVLSWILIGGRFFYLGDWFDKAVDLILAAIVLKVYGRELVRYRQLLNELNRRHWS